MQMRHNIARNDNEALERELASVNDDEPRSLHQQLRIGIVY